MNLSKLFDFKTGDLPALENTEDGNVPLVYGSTENNGVEKFVKVDRTQTIFDPPLITVSYLGTACVQVLPFTTSVVDKSNIIVLVPKKNMSLEEMYHHALQINRIGNFGFHYGRRLNMKKLKKLQLIPFKNKLKKIEFRKLLPKIKKQNNPLARNYQKTPLTELFEISNSFSLGYENYEHGKVPFISNGTNNNGLVGYVTPRKKDRIFKKDGICVSSFCVTTVQEAPFLPRGNGGSGLLVITPLKKMKKSEMYFHAAYINQVYGWRFSYGRMVTRDRLAQFELRTAK